MRNLVMLSLILLNVHAHAESIEGNVFDHLGQPVAGVTVWEMGTTNRSKTDSQGYFNLELKTTKPVLEFYHQDFEYAKKKVNGKSKMKIYLTPKVILEEEVLMEADEVNYAKRLNATGAVSRSLASPAEFAIRGQAKIAYDQGYFHNTEDYATIHENGFKKVLDKPLSTFSIDVDAASYSNMRRFINNGQLPPKDAVRIEEMINYFNYDYKNPSGSDPFSINTEVAVAPWNKDHLIAHVGLQGKKIELENLPASNIVFLLDVSGSMSSPNKLPLLKSAFKLLVNELRPQDKVSIVVYAGAAGMVLKPTDGNDKKKIMDALDKLEAGGSTAGGAGIELAYRTAKANFVEGGNNRVILATDGDFNVGASSNAAMERLIEERRNEGVFLTVLGFGMGNYKDSKMEILADKGNGNYAYIDTMKEAKKVLVNEFGGTMFTIAKDVKIQVEFNPAVVQGYRLIGYENRLLNDEDFNDDKKDAGELGSGHTVTALYEIIPVGVESEFLKDIDPLKYQNDNQQVTTATDELLTVKFRYKEPDGDKSKLITEVVDNEIGESSNNLNWSMAVAGFGMLLRDSEYKNDLSYTEVLQMAKSSKGKDAFGYRKEFIELVDLAMNMQAGQ